MVGGPVVTTDGGGVSGGGGDRAAGQEWGPPERSVSTRGPRSW
jgi:hypothetical protein